MPTLLTSSLTIKEMESQLPSSSFIATQSMQLLIEALREAFDEPMRQFKEEIGKMLENQNNELGKALARQFALNKIFPKDFFTALAPFKTINLDIFEGINVIEGEIKETREIGIPLLPTITSRTHRSIMGLRQISGGNFSYKRKTLLGLSLNNREGQLMRVMLESLDLFISDRTIDEKFYTEDVLGRSDLVRLLKKKFKLNKLKAIIKRQGEGYILININSIYVN